MQRERLSDQESLAAIAEYLEAIRGSLSTLTTIVSILAFPLIVGLIAYVFAGVTGGFDN